MGEAEIVMGFDPEEADYIGRGREKLVYPASPPHEKKRVVKITVSDVDGHFTEGNERRLSAEAYLTKILHLLMPVTIPDIYRTSFKHRATLHEHKVFGPDHDIVAEELKLISTPLPEMSTNPDIIPAMKHLRQARNESNFMTTMARLGITHVDSMPQNFGSDAQDNIVYADTIEPWFLSTTGGREVLEKNYNPAALQEAIYEQLSEPEQTQALKHLVRLETLAREQEASLD